MFSKKENWGGKTTVGSCWNNERFHTHLLKKKKRKKKEEEPTNQTNKQQNNTNNRKYNTGDA